MLTKQENGLSNRFELYHCSKFSVEKTVKVLAVIVPNIDRFKYGDRNF